MISAKYYLVAMINELAPFTIINLKLFNDSKIEWLGESRPWAKEIYINQFYIDRDKYTEIEIFDMLAHEIGHFKIPLIKDARSIWELNCQLWAIGRLVELKKRKDYITCAVDTLKSWKNYKGDNATNIYRKASLLFEAYKIESKISIKNPLWIIIKDIHNKLHLVKRELKAYKYNWCFEEEN